MSEIMEGAAPAAEAPASSAPPAGDAPATPAPEVTATEGEATKAGDTKPADPKPARTFTQDDIERIVSRERAKAERRAERYGYERAMREAAERQLAERTNPTQQATEPRAEGKPSPNQFADWDAYTEALTEWKVEQKLMDRERRASEAKQVQAHQKEREEVLTKLQSAMEKYEDFEEVVGSIPLSRETFRAAMSLGNDGHDVLYHLGNNPREAQRIYELEGTEQVRAVDRLAATLKAAPTPTKAPEPIKPNAGTGAVADTLESAANNYQAWLKVRNRQLGRDKK